MNDKQPTTIDEYIESFPAETQAVLREIRRIIRSAAPDATERISYGIPTFDSNGPLLYFAGFRNHVSVYPAPRGSAEFSEELAAYKGGKGTAQFPLGKPIPADLIRRIVEFRLRSNEEAAAVRSKTRGTARRRRTSGGTGG